jgi:hypothetical protein
MDDVVRPKNCERCGEPIKPGEENSIGHTPLHGECLFRMVMGCAAHIEKRCSCFVPGSHEHDDEGLTLREAAWAAVRAWEKRERVKWSGNL